MAWMEPPVTNKNHPWAGTWKEAMAVVVADLLLAVFLFGVGLIVYLARK